MMKRTIILLIGLMAASMFAFVACDDEPTQEEANEAFCDDVAELIASLRVLEDLDRNSTVEEIQDARDRAQDAYDAMLDSAAGVVEANLDAVEQAYDDLIAAVDAVDDESTVQQALEEVDEELANLSSEVSQVLNDVDCGGTSSGGTGGE